VNVITCHQRQHATVSPCYDWARSNWLLRQIGVGHRCRQAVRGTSLRCPLTRARHLSGTGIIPTPISAGACLQTSQGGLIRGGLEAMSSGGAWGAKVWGGSTSTADRDRLPKGDEPCHICGEDAMVEVKLQPCQHEICLGCCNAMRANVVFKVSPRGPLRGAPPATLRHVWAGFRAAAASPCRCLQADAGLKCPFCRDYVDGFTDMQGCATAAAHRQPPAAGPACCLLGHCCSAALAFMRKQL
jgi:hypothetical protein